MKIIVYHSFYSCDTGCCGHTVNLFDDDVVNSKDFNPYLSDAIDESKNYFRFDHPSCGDPIEFAKNLVRETYGEEHVKDLDWEHCEVVDDC